MWNRRFYLIPVLAAVMACAVYAQSRDVLAVDLYGHGVAQQRNGNWHLALQDFMEVVDRNPAFSDAWLRMAECSYRLGEYELALEYVSGAEKYDGTDPSVRNMKGSILLALGRTDEASRIFDGVLSSYPNNVDARFGLAEIELYGGKFSGAEQQYKEALRRQPNNRRALLSLAVLCSETGRTGESDRYMQRALSLYSGDSDVHHLAAVVSAMKGDYAAAEKYSRIEVELAGDSDPAYEFLALILFRRRQYSDVIDICDFLTARTPENSAAWYMKGLSLRKLGDPEGAVDVWSSGLAVNPRDEMMRSAMEMEIRRNFPLEDTHRSEWASFHIDNARQYSAGYDGAGAVYEYQRALLLDPTNIPARLEYAGILELNGMYELYLEQLNFIKTRTDMSSLSAERQTALNDTVEAYTSLLSGSLAARWNVDPFYLDKTRWRIAVFYEDGTKSFIHADSDRLAAESAADVFSGVAVTSVKTQVNPVSGFGEAFRNARAGKFDYFVTVSLSEGEHDLTLDAAMYSGRTGTEIYRDSFYGTGNNRFSSVLRRFRSAVLGKLSVRGKILARSGKRVLVDLGKSENVVIGSEFRIERKDSVRIADTDAGLYYRDSDVVGTFTVTEAGEEVSEGVLSDLGFYDKVNPGDEVVLVSVPESASGEDVNPVDTVPAADADGNPVTDGASLISEIKNAVERPAIIDILRNIH